MEAVFSNLRVHMDPFWYTELIGKGLNIKTELTTFSRLMDMVGFDQFISFLSKLLDENILLNYYLVEYIFIYKSRYKHYYKN